MGLGVNRIFVWDLPQRLFHWLLVLLIVVSWVSVTAGGNAMQIHFLSGYTILTLVLFRVAWGFLGTRHARFDSFMRSPRAAVAYLRSLRSNDAAPHLGHNPAGGWSVILMLAILLLQSATGLFANDDIAAAGPLAKLVSKALSDRITGIHHISVKLLYALIGLHLSAVAYYVFYRKENLVTPMLTGYKDSGEKHAAPDRQRNWLAALVLAACAGGVVILIKAA